MALYDVRILFSFSGDITRLGGSASGTIIDAPDSAAARVAAIAFFTTTFSLVGSVAIASIKAVGVIQGDQAPPLGPPLASSSPVAELLPPFGLLPGGR